MSIFTEKELHLIRAKYEGMEGEIVSGSKTEKEIIDHIYQLISSLGPMALQELVSAKVPLLSEIAHNVLRGN